MYNKYEINCIVELYDRERILNVLAAIEFSPEQVFIIGDECVLNVAERARLESFFAGYRQITLNFLATDLRRIEDITASLESIFKLHPDAVIDVTGGNELALIAVGMYAKTHGASLIYYDQKQKRFLNVLNCPCANARTFSGRLTFDDFLRLSGACVSGHSHFNPNTMRKSSLSLIANAWLTFLDMGGAWQRQARFFQNANKFLLPDSSLSISAPSSGCNSRAMRALKDAGLITELHAEGGRVSFKYADETIKRTLSTTGAWLELYVYNTALESGRFYDVDMDVVIDWDGGKKEPQDTLNEIDVTLMNDITPIFISCKTGSFGSQDINEFAGVFNRLGGSFAKGAIVTSMDAYTLNGSLYKRAAELNIAIIDREDMLSGRMIDRLLALDHDSYSLEQHFR